MTTITIAPPGRYAAVQDGVVRYRGSRSTMSRVAYARGGRIRGWWVSESSAAVGQAWDSPIYVRTTSTIGARP